MCVGRSSLLDAWVVFLVSLWVLFVLFGPIKNSFILLCLSKNRALLMPLLVETTLEGKFVKMEAWIFLVFSFAAGF